MTNHVHLLLAPEEPAGIGRLMKRLAGRQTRHHNRLEGRSGTLWEGRYKSSLVEREDYLMACCRYIELNPIRARMVAEPQDLCLVELPLPPRAGKRRLARPRSLLPRPGSKRDRAAPLLSRVPENSDPKRGVGANPRGRPARTTHRDQPLHRRGCRHSRTARGTPRTGATGEVRSCGRSTEGALLKISLKINLSPFSSFCARSGGFRMARCRRDSGWTARRPPTG